MRKLPSVFVQDRGRERRAAVMAVWIWSDGVLVGSFRIAVYFSARFGGRDHTVDLDWVEIAMRGAWWVGLRSGMSM